MTYQEGWPQVGAPHLLPWGPRGQAGPEEGPMAARVAVGLEAAQGLQRAGVQDYEGGADSLWVGGLGFGAALSGPASGVVWWLVTHTSAALAVVMMLGRLPASELGSSGLLLP